jgi:tape measure domain-containing protein
MFNNKLHLPSTSLVSSSIILRQVVSGATLNMVIEDVSENVLSILETSFGVTKGSFEKFMKAAFRRGG